MRTRWIGIGAVSGALAVLLGAFGAHGLKERVGPAELEWWHTAVLYHALHALGLVAYGLFQEKRASGGLPGVCFLAGSAIFSGTLYAMTLGAPRWLGMVTPIGGVLLIVAWLAFAVQAFRAPASR